MRARVITTDGYQITHKLDLKHLGWCREQRDKINRDPARRAYVKEENGTCAVYDRRPPKRVASSSVRDSLLNKRYRGEE